MPYRSLRKWFILLVCLSGLIGCQQPEPQPPLIKVGQRQLSLQQFENELLLSYPDLDELAETEQFILKTQLLNRLIERELILAEAERIDVQITPDELDAAMIELRGNYTAEEYRQILQDAGQSEQSWKAALMLRLITIKVSRAAFAAQTQVVDSDAEKYYLAHRDEFRRPAELRARQMLFNNSEDAKQVLKELKAGGNFADLAREHSLSPDREDGGNLGYFSQGQLPPEFDQALFNLPVGQVSDPVESPYGVHLFLVERRRRAGLRPFAAVAEEIMNKLSQQREEEAFQQWLENLHHSTPVSVTWELLTKKSAP